MDWIAAHWSSGFVGFIIGTLAAGIVAYLKFGKYVGLVYFLTVAIERFDKAVADIVPDETWTKMKPIKEFIARTIPKDLKARLDAVLIKQEFMDAPGMVEKGGAT